MSLKAELETWSAALKAYDDEDFAKSIELFERIGDTSKILCNIGLIFATLGAHESAVDNFNAATSLDKHLAVAYFQCGVSNFLLGRYELAYKDFDEALVHLRGNQFIDYDQLGLKFKLWSAEVIFNKGLCQIYLNNVDMGMRDLRAAQQEKTTDEHSVIDEAIEKRGEDYTVFSIPVGVLYRPSEGKTKNLKTKDYMGKAKLVSASEERDAFTGFHGAKRLEQGLGPQGQPLNMPPTEKPAAAPVTRVPPPALDNSPGRPRVNRSQTTRVPLANPRLLDARPRAGSAEDVTTLRRADTSATIRPAANGVPTRAQTITRPRGNTDISGGGRARDQDRGGGGGSGGGGPIVPTKEVNSQGRSTPISDQRRTPAPVFAPVDLDRRPSANDTGRGVMTQIYEDYLDGYDLPPPQLPQPPTQTRSQLRVEEEERFDPLEVAVDSTRRVAAWQSRTVAGASPNIPPSRVTSTRGPISVGGGVRREPSKKNLYAKTAKSASRYMDDEDDQRSYASETQEVPFELMKIRIKLHYDDDVRGMAIPSQTGFDEFVDMVTGKFSRRWNDLSFKFKDEDGGKISLKDAMDWDMAIEVARETINPQGKPEARLEIWVSDR